MQGKEGDMVEGKRVALRYALANRPGQAGDKGTGSLGVPFGWFARDPGLKSETWGTHPVAYPAAMSWVEGRFPLVLLPVEETADPSDGKPGRVGFAPRQAGTGGMTKEKSGGVSLGDGCRGYDVGLKDDLVG